MGLVGGYESREGKKSEKIEERYGVVRGKGKGRREERKERK